MAVHFKNHCNTYGSLAAYIVGFAVRLSGGEPLIGLQALIHFPGYDEEKQRQLFPFRTMTMLMSLITLWIVSVCTKFISKTGRLRSKCEFKVFNNDATDVGDPTKVKEQVSIN